MARRTILLPEAPDQGMFSLKQEGEQDVARKAVDQGGGLAVLGTAPIQVLTKMSTAEAKKSLLDLIEAQAKPPKGPPPAAPTEGHVSAGLPTIKKKGKTLFVTREQMDQYFGIHNPAENARKLADYRQAVMFKQFAKESKIETFIKEHPMDDAPRPVERPMLTRQYCNLYRRKPTEEEIEAGKTCIRGEECLVKRGDANRGYKALQFELPAGYEPLPPRYAGKCIDCIEAEVNIQASRNQESGTGSPATPLNPWTVHCGEGGYDPRRMWNERNEHNISGIVGYFPIYSQSYRTYDVPIPDDKVVELGLDPNQKHYHCADIMDFQNASAEPTFGAD